MDDRGLVASAHLLGGETTGSIPDFYRVILKTLNIVLIGAWLGPGHKGVKTFKGKFKVIWADTL